MIKPYKDLFPIPGVEATDILFPLLQAITGKYGEPTRKSLERSTAKGLAGLMKGVYTVAEWMQPVSSQSIVVELVCSIPKKRPKEKEYSLHVEMTDLHNGRENIGKADF